MAVPPMEETPPNAQQYRDDKKQGSVDAGSNQPDDTTLLRRAGLGDSRAFHALVDRHADRLFRLACSLLGNAADAEDVVQETFAGAFRGIKGFEGRSQVGTWLTRILVNQAALSRRQKKRTEPVTEDVGARGSGLAAAQTRMDLLWALDQLTPEHKQVLVLREFEQLSYEEIAQVLGIPRGTVESRLHRARAELRDRLKAYAT
jgi:RNA polymerase sigma-70 factor, ECF subfamily